MKGLLQRFIQKGKSKQGSAKVDRQLLKRQVTALFGLLTDMYGSDQLILKAGKLDALHLMRSDKLEDRINALERIVYEDPTVREEYDPAELTEILDELENTLADQLARRSVEEELEKKDNEKLQERQVE